MLMELGKVRITLMVAFSTAAGFILASGYDIITLIAAVVGTFLLACGSSAMNHYQERDLDAKMDRTRNRPIPSGAISPNKVLLVIIVLLSGGFLVLGIFTTIESVLLGLLAVLWYNVVYTPMKRVTALAVLPGALIGSIPPAIGWTAAGESVTDAGIIALALFFFIWQIPHFWLLLLMYDKDYKKAGYPTLTRFFDHIQIARLTFLWLLALSVSGLILAISGVVSHPVVFLIVLVMSVHLVWKSRYLFNEAKKSYRTEFMLVNVYVLVVVVVVSLNKIFLY